MKPYMSEGFQSGGKQLLDKMVLCPALRGGINYNTELIEGYTEQAAVTSAKNAQDILKHMTDAYEEHDCESYMKTNPEKEE